MPEEMFARGKDVIRPNERYANTSIDACIAAADGLRNRIDAISSRMDAIAKVSKASVDYSLGKGEDRCKNCTHFDAPKFCEIVNGDIDPEYWCKRFLVSQT